MTSPNHDKLLSTPTPELCIKCQEMYGHQTFANMCSKCFKLSKSPTQPQTLKTPLTQEKEQLKPQKPIQQKQTQQKIEPQSSAPLNHKETNPNVQIKTERQRTRQKEEKKTFNKCFTCSKKTGILGHQCKHCSNLFCKFHRLPEDHQCGVDFVSAGKLILKAAIPELKTRKMSGIDDGN